MTALKIIRDTHSTDIELADLLSGCLSKIARARIERHVSSCRECMDKIVASHESVGPYKKNTPSKKRKGAAVGKINIYLLLAILSFSLSFLAPRYFIQSLVVTLLFGIKWVVDSKSTKMLVMINEAWKKDGDRSASRAFKSTEKRRTDLY